MARAKDHRLAEHLSPSKSLRTPLLWALLLVFLGGPLRAEPPGGPVDKGARIAIIGAGPAGLTAAWDLTRGGYENVTVFEREARVGGRVHTLELDGQIFENGAAFTFDAYETVQALAEAVDYPSAPLPIQTWVVQGGAPIPERAYFARKPLRTAIQRRRMKALVERYGSIGDADYPAAHPDLFLPFDAFIAKHRVRIYGEKMALVFTALGLGYPSDIPAIYYMRMLGWFDVRLFAPLDERYSRLCVQPNDYYPEGFQGLWERVAADIDVRLSQEVTAVVRRPEGEGSVVDVTTSAGTQTFDYLIVATGLSAARRFLDLTPGEAALLDQVQTYDYWVTAFRSTGMEPWTGEVFADAVYDKTGAPLLALFRPGTTDVYFAYQLTTEPRTEAEILARLEGDLKASGHSLGEVEAVTRWTYFPHVGPEATAKGFFVEMAALQGSLNTFYVGGGLSFDSVEDNARHARAIIERHFTSAE